MEGAGVVEEARCTVIWRRVGGLGGVILIHEDSVISNSRNTLGDLKQNEVENQL